ncbi:carbohydrate ABC transporter permease [Paenibacillus antri]|uniref:Carbohydrate ABC transporter permease n=1 Tax=Paenibacillus antri TaxID=2582848 RepID=A0A5R9GBZ5_9BACL|nr:carbohydrate ABC transporter permease [Paenibacillus antri]TLS52609.1 carbohydrate ABC transporter permease [Paenibacillus antri]
MAVSSSTIVKGRFDWGGLALYAFLTVLALFMLAPLVYMVSTAFKPISELFLFPPRFFVMNPTLKNFHNLLLASGTSFVPFTRYAFNSVVVSLGIVVGGVLISAMAAYPLSKHVDMPFRKSIFNVVILALMFAPQVTQIPQYLVINKLGLMNTYFALVIPYLAYPVGLFLMKQFLDQIPDALLEAGKMDGAKEWTIFWKIVMPLLKPAWSTLALFVFVAAWNDPWSSAVYTTTEDMKSLPYALTTINGGTANAIATAGTLGAASLLMIVPTVLVFVVTQKMVLETMAHSGIKE